MKEIKITGLIISAFLLFIFVSSPALADNIADSDICYLSYSSASALKSELNSLNREVKANESKIRTIKVSKKISQNEKRIKISRLERRNNELKRKIKKIKTDYAKAIS